MSTETVPAGSDELVDGVPITRRAHPARSVGANIASLATSQAITWTLALLWTFIVPRLVGPEQMGLLIIGQSLSVVVAVVLSLIPRDFLVREMVADRSSARRLVSTALIARAAVVPVIFLAAALYGRVADLDGHAMQVMYFMAGATACAILMDPALATFQSAERMQYIAYTDVGNKSLNTLGGVVLALAGYGVVAIAGFGFLVAIVALSAALWWAHRIIGLGARPAPMVATVRRAGPYWFVAVFFVVYLWADGFLLGVLVPPEVVVWYGAATRLFTTMVFGAAIIATASLPRMVTAHGEGRPQFYAAVRKPFEWAVLLGLPLGVGLAVTAGKVVPLLYGSEYSQSVVPLVLLSLGLPLMYLNTIVGQSLIASGRPTRIGWLLAAATVFNICLNLVLIPMTQEHWGNGAIGAGVSLLLTELVQAVMGLALVGRGLLVSSTVRRVRLTALASVVMAGAVLLANPLPLVAQVVLGVVVFLVMVVMLRIPTTEERAFARRVRDKLAAKVRRNAADAS